MLIQHFFRKTCYVKIFHLHSGEFYQYYAYSVVINGWLPGSIQSIRLWTEAVFILNCKRLNATVLNHNISVNIQRYIISTLTPAVLNTVCSCHASISPLSFPAKGPYIEKRVGWQSFANLLGTQNISSPSWKISSNILLHWNVKFSILNRYLWWLIW